MNEGPLVVSIQPESGDLKKSLLSVVSKSIGVNLSFLV